MAPPTTFSPVAEREIYLARELVPGTIPATVGFPWPVTSFKPSNKPMWINDESFQGSMGDNFGVYQGPLIAGWDAGGHVFADVFPLLCWSILGDYTASGTAASPAGTTSAPVSAGATNLTVASGGASFTAGMFVWIEDAGTPAANEVVKIGAGSTSTNVVLDATTPTRFAHLTATPFTNTTAPYTHVFALLNGSTGALAGPGQPPTLCATNRNGIAANGAEQYAYSCLSELTLTGNAEKLLDFTAKAVCMSRQTAAAPVGFANISSELATPSWRTAAGIGGIASGGTQVKSIAEHTVTLSRAVKAYNTEQGSQAPFVIARGKQGNTGKMVVSPAIDDSTLIALLANSQPQLQFVTDNGLAGASHRLVQADILLAAYDTDDENDGSELFGFDVSFRAVHTAASSGGITTTGASGGKGAVKITVVNATPTY